MNVIYEGDKDTLIRVDVGTDVSGATAEMIVERGNTTMNWAATVNGQFIEYRTNGTNDVNIAGVYKIQAHVIDGSWDGLGKTARLNVKKRFS